MTTLSMRLRTISLLGTAAVLVGVLHVLTSSQALQPAVAHHNDAAHQPECSDGIDNDDDTHVDYPEDSDCSSPNDDFEVSYDHVRRVTRRHDEGAARIRLSVTDGKETALPEEVLKYRIGVQNLENHSVEVDLRTTVPAEFILHEVSGPHRKEGRKIVWDNIPLEAGQAREYFVIGNVERDTPDYYALRLRATAGRAVATDHTTIGAQSLVNNSLTLTLTDGRRNVRPGELLTYEVHLDNSAGLLITNLDVNAGLPNHTEFISSSDGGYWTGSSIYWKNLTVAPAGKRVLHYTVRVRNGAPVGTQVRAGVVASGNEAYDVNDIGAGEVYASNRAPLPKRNALVKYSNKSEVQPGQTVTYVVSLRNTTDWPFRNVSIHDEFQAAYMTPVSLQNGEVQGNKIHWHVPQIAPGQEWKASYTMRVHGNVPHGMFINNQVSASGEGLEKLSTSERVYSYRVGVLRKLPRTGAGMDGILLTLNALFGLVPAYAVARRKMFIG